MNFAGWPFAVVYGPLQALFGTVAGWNVFVLLTYVGAGGLAALWLRALGLGLGPALVGGLAFALAPYRVAQSTGHLLGPISMLLPLALYGVERRKTWLAAAALASIPLSGQVHLALGAIPFVLVYALARRRAVARGDRRRRGGRRRRRSSGRSRSATRSSAPSRRSGATRPRSATSSRATRASSSASPTSAGSSRSPRSPGSGACVSETQSPPGAGSRSCSDSARSSPCLLALGSNLPGYGLLWRNTPLHSTRVPERMLPIACLCLAALAAVAVACVSETQARSRLVAAVACLAVAADLWVPLYDPLVADEENPVYARVADAPAGRLLEVPVLPPDAYAGSVYLYYAMQAPRERPLGYATSAPPAAFAAARRLPEARPRARRQRRRRVPRRRPAPHAISLVENRKRRYR